MQVICICGRPLAGKTTAAQILRAAYGWRTLEADHVGESVLVRLRGSLPPLERLALKPAIEGGSWRREYPYRDAQRVEWEQPEEFWTELVGKIRSDLSPAVVVGLRCSRMLRRLKACFRRRAGILYVAAGTRVCSTRYGEQTHEPKNRYLDLLGYAVEADQQKLHDLAAVIVRNCASLDAFRERLLARIHPECRILRASLDRCSCCGQVAQVHIRAEAGRAAVCQKCYEERFNTERCSRCGRPRPVHQRNRSGEAICKNCYQKVGNVQVCCCCARRRTVYRRDTDGRPFCKSCSRKLP